VTFFEPGLIVGILGILGVLTSLIALRKHRFAVRSMMGEHKVECSGQIEHLRLELQLLRSGMPPEKMGRREMQLIARISRTLAPQ
jgi:hypothetical protein